MLKNYHLINGFLGLTLITVVFFIIRSTQMPVVEETLLQLPSPSEQTPVAVETSAELVPVASELDEQYSTIAENTLFNPQRKLRPTATPAVFMTMTPTPYEFDCAATNIKLTGIVHIENEKPYCFLHQPKETGNQIQLFYENQNIGMYSITKIDDELIKITAEDGSICEIMLFDFNGQTSSGNRPPPSRRRPTPTPRQRHVSR